MPYITTENRSDLHNGKSPSTPGELNYCFTLIALEYIKTVGERYQTYNDIVGALECCKLELQRRLIGKYEDKKITENGDVYETGTPEKTI
jgi:hypothetical protein